MDIATQIEEWQELAENPKFIGQMVALQANKGSQTYMGPITQIRVEGDMVYIHSDAWRYTYDRNSPYESGTPAERSPIRFRLDEAECITRTGNYLFYELDEWRQVMINCPASVAA